MNGRKTLILIAMVFLIAAGFYFFTTPSGSEIPLTGIVDGNEVIVSPQIMGRIVNLTVDEGSQVKKGDSRRRRQTLQACSHKSAKRITTTP